MDDAAQGNTGDRERIAELMRRLGSMDDVARLQARKSLVQIGKPAIYALVEGHENPNHLVRWGIIKALTEIGDPSIAPVLVEVLEDDVFDLRWVASEGLISLGAHGLKPLLSALVANPESPNLREGARHIFYVFHETELGDLLAPLWSAIETQGPISSLRLAARQVLDALDREAHTS